MTTFPKKEYPVRWIPVKQISTIWRESQRALSERRVKQIMADFDADAVGVITLTLPAEDSGIHHCIDGQHRVEAIRRMWGEKENVPALVLGAMDPAEAANIWLLMNTGRTKPSTMDVFRVSVTAGREAETMVSQILTKLGYHIGSGGDDGYISAVASCLTVFKKHGPEVLEDALRTIQLAWDKARDSVHGNVIQGMADLVAAHNGALDRKRLAEKLSKKYTPARFLGAARQARDVVGGSMADGVRVVLVNAYNANLAIDRRLPEK